MGYDRDELINIGERFPADALVDWCGQIVQAARQDLPRLKQKGVTEQMLRGIEAARDEAKKIFIQERDRREDSPLAAARREAMEEAYDWREEIRGLAKAVFDSEPEMLARFWPGVKVSRSLPKLTWETGRLLATTREHVRGLHGVGIDDDMIARGEEILHKLEEAGRRLPEERRELPPSLLELYHALGVLYTRTRFVVRVAHVQFRRDPDRLAKYSYTPIRKVEMTTPETRRPRMAAALASR